MEQKREASVGMRGSRGVGTVVLGHIANQSRVVRIPQPQAWGFMQPPPDILPLDLHLNVGNQLDSANVRKYINYSRKVCTAYTALMETSDGH